LFSAVKPLRNTILTVMALLLYTVMVFGIVGASDRLDAGERILDLRKDGRWEVFMGEVPVRSGIPEESSVAWRPIDELQDTPEGLRNTGVFWVKRSLPGKEGGWRDPHLWIKRQQQYTVYVNGALLGEVDRQGDNRYDHPGYMWRMYELPSGGKPQTLLVRIDPAVPGLKLGQYILGEGTALQSEMLRYDTMGLIYSLLFGMLGLVSAIVYLRAPKDSAYLWFAVITFCGGAAYLLRTMSIQRFPVPDILLYFTDMPGVIATGAFLMFLYHFLSGPRNKLLLWFANITFSLSAVCIGLGIAADFGTYRAVYDALFLPLLAVEAVVAVVPLIKRIRSDADPETGWIISGMLSAVLCTIMHTAGLILVNSPGTFRFATTPYLYFFEHVAGLGVLIFVVSLGMAMVTRMVRIRREHHQFTVALEHMVKERTLELEGANRLLRQSIRERSEALAEMAVLEERTRIARDIHDVVGHTLTTTLVQIEAAKKLLAREVEQGLSRLDLSMELVRKSLQDIRESVHRMQSAGVEYDLEEAMHELSSLTEMAAGVEVNGTIGTMPHLSLLQKKVIFHTLQEGMTNGIRHGKAKAFRYELWHDGKSVFFELWNNGEPFRQEVPMGFGLTNMRERIQQIGGSLEISSPEGDGYQLNIRFPVR
jgi:signal transduction histidine kinase